MQVFAEFVSSMPLKYLEAKLKYETVKYVGTNLFLAKDYSFSNFFNFEFINCSSYKCWLLIFEGASPNPNNFRGDSQKFVPAFEGRIILFKFLNTKLSLLVLGIYLMK